MSVSQPSTLEVLKSVPRLWLMGPAVGNRTKMFQEPVSGLLFQCVSILVHFLSFFGTRIPLDIHRLGRFYQGDEATIQFWFTFMNACKVSNPQQQDELNTYCISTAVAHFGAEPYSSWSEKPLGSPSGCECSWTTWELGP